jgi:hypothetical protein
MSNRRELISPGTRDAFRDAAVSLCKATGETCFERLEAAGIEPIGLPRGRPPTIGELLEGYFAAVDWTDRQAIEPLAVFEELVRRVPDSVWGHRAEIAERLFEDGLQITGGRLAMLPL